ncbi:MAG: tetratricopeptide repeat protein [Nitrosarchaeum sp.]|nr:tetratricopeptide repeat protein [Nitrosarchaeum sp.]
MDDPNNVEVLSNKASTLGKLGRISEAITYYDKALDINPNFLPAINNKANALATLGQYDEAKKLYESAIAKNPSYITAKENLSILNSQIPPNIPVVLKTQSNQNHESNNDVSVIHGLTGKETSDSLNESFNFFEEMSVVFSSLFGFLK